jgi:hypothetical protein
MQIRMVPVETADEKPEVRWQYHLQYAPNTRCVLVLPTEDKLMKRERDGESAGEVLLLRNISPASVLYLKLAHFDAVSVFARVEIIAADTGHGTDCKRKEVLMATEAHEMCVY